MDRRLSAAMPAGVLALALSAHFILQTVLMNRIAPLWLAAAGTIAAAFVALAIAGLPSMQRLRALPRRELAIAGVLGIIGLWLPQVLVLTHRFTDAPSGSESLFFMTAAWAPLVFLASSAAGERPLAARWGGLLIGVLGAAAMLANWERPSSFSPFVKFPVLEAYMLLGGLAWAVYGAGLRRFGAALTPRGAIGVGGGAAAVVGLLVAVVAGGPVPSAELNASALELVLFGAALGAAWWAWTRLSAAGFVSNGAVPLLFPVVLLTALSFTEQFGAVFGPRPILLAPATAGAALVVLGGVGAWRWTQEGRERRSRDLLSTAALALAALAFAAGVAAAVSPRLAASVAGEYAGEVFNVQWRYLGIETVGGWFALLAPLALACRLLTPASRRALYVWSMGAVLAATAYWYVADTPLRTWTRWLPPEVQQDYGTEYARFVIEPLVSWPERGAVLAALAGSLALAGIATRRKNQEADAIQE